MANIDKTSEPQETPRLLRDVVYEQLKDDIRHGELRPGEPLSENRLSNQLNISRTPIREALQRLSQEGLVRNVPGQGVTVAAPSMKEVFNVIHIRSLLAPELARLAAESITPDDLDQLKQAIETMEAAVETGDRKSWSKADTRFHEALGRACPNKLLGQLALQMRNRIHYMTANTQTSQKRVGACTKEHRAVAEAVIKNDGAAAAKAMSHHIEQLRESLFKQLAHQ